MTNDLRLSSGSSARAMHSLLGSCLLAVPLLSCQAMEPAPAPKAAAPATQVTTINVAKMPVAATPVAAPAHSAPAIAVAAPLAVQADGTSIFGAPVIVNGRRITDNEIKRYLCHAIGHSDVDMFKFGVMIRQELSKRRQAGATEAELARFGVSDAELERRIKREREDFLLRYPSLDFATEVGRAELSLELFRDRLRQTMVFDKLFMSDDPKDWPEITRSIIIEGLGEGWINDSVISYSTRLKRMFQGQREQMNQLGFGAYLDQLEAIGDRDSVTLIAALENPLAQQALAKLTEAGVGDIQPDDPIAIEATRSTLLQAFNNYAIVHIDADAIAAALPAGDPAAVAAEADAIIELVEGEPVYIDQVWKRVGPYATPENVTDAKRFLTLIALLEHDLAAKGALMTPAEFRAWWPTTARNDQKYTYMEFLNQNEMLSSQVLGFPSLFSFSHYIRVIESYRKTIADELAKDELLVPLLPMINQIAGAAKLSVNVILLSAYDFDHCKWKENGWADAKQRALDLKAALDGGAEWKPMLDLHSEWWDPPMPEFGNKPMQNYYFGGTFGDQPLTRNQVMNYLLESEFRTLLYGAPATDHIFFEQKMGTVDGPFRGPKGYYIARITAKSPPSRPLDLKEPVHRQIAEHHYLKNSLNARAMSLLNEGVQAGTIKGVELGGGRYEL